LFPLSVLFLARVLKRSPWLALGAFALEFNQNWIYGFASYLMGTCFLFFSLGLLMRYLREGARRDLYWLAFTVVVTYFGHVLCWFVFGVCAIGLLLLHRQKVGRLAFAAIALSPTVLMAFYAYLEDKGSHAYMKYGDSFHAYWKDFPQSVMDFHKRVMELFPGPIDTLVFVTLALTVLGLCLWRGTRLEKEAEVSTQKELTVTLILMGLLYVSLPYEIVKPMKWWYVAPRLPSMMAVLFLLLPAAELRRKRVLLIAPMVLACVVLPIKLATLYRDFSARNIAFMRLIQMVPRGKKTMVAVRGMMRGPHSEEQSGDPATSGPVYWHFSSWPMALNGGYGPYIFDQGIPIRPKVVYPIPSWTQVDNFDIRQAPDFDYYLVRYPSDEMDREPSLKVIERGGEWALYQRVAKLTDEP
jgi:hypothetical protein